MIRLLNSNKILILILFFISCDDSSTCPGAQILDSCGVCRDGVNDSNWDNCRDNCGVLNGINNCSPYGVCMGWCSCDGCSKWGNINYDPDRVIDNDCKCSYDNYSEYIIQIKENCINNACTYYFEPDNNIINFSFFDSGPVQYANILQVANTTGNTLNISSDDININENIEPNNTFTLNSSNYNFIEDQINGYSISIKTPSGTEINSFLINELVYNNVDYFQTIIDNCNDTSNCNE